MNSLCLILFIYYCSILDVLSVYTHLKKRKKGKRKRIQSSLEHDSARFVTTDLFPVSHIDEGENGPLQVAL